MNLDRLVRRVTALDARPGAERVVVGIVGAPGAGKTTFAEALTAALNEWEGSPAGRPGYAHMPMDGFHLSDAVLDDLGLRDRKGAPETFDVYGFTAVLRRVTADRRHPIYVPGFQRTLEQPIAAALAIPVSAHTVITEGNYLLVDRPGWRDVQPLCTEVWFCQQDDRTRIDRLIERHVRFGKTRDQAVEWVRRVDQANAELVNATRARADLHVRLD